MFTISAASRTSLRIYIEMGKEEKRTPQRRLTK